MPDGSLLVVSRCDGTVLRRWPNGDVMVHAEVAHLCGGYLNDMVVDRHGRAYVGEMGFALDDFADPTTAVLIRIDPDGTASVAAEDLYFPNGAVITPDGGTLIVGETAGARYTAFSIAPDGSPRPPGVGAGRHDANADHLRRDAGSAAVWAGRLHLGRRRDDLVGGRGRGALRTPGARR